MISSTSVLLLLLAGPAQADENDASLGAAVYRTECQSCHGSDGTAADSALRSVNSAPRSLTARRVQRRSDEELASVVRDGGAARGRSPLMPAYADLSEEEVAAVVLWVRRLADPPEPAVAAAE